MTNEPQELGHLLRTLDRRLDEKFAEVLSARRLTPRQWQILGVLAETRSTLGQLDEAVAPLLDAANRESSELDLKDLVGGGLVAEKAGVYHLTDAGRTQYRAVHEAIDGLREIVVQGLGDGEYERTVRALEAMIDNLE